MKLYCLLGAEKFQKVVFSVEKTKYWIIEKYFPEIIGWYERQCDKQFKKRISKENVEDEKALLNEFQNQKLAFRKELVYKQNRNYHYNPNYPTKFIEYLQINKRIHQRRMIKNIVALVGIAVISLLFGNLFPIVSIGLMVLEGIGLIINFECINLQNYNLCRFEDEKMKNLLTKLEEYKLNTNLEKLSEGMKPVSELITTQVEIPTIDQVVDNITNRTQAKQLLEYMKEQLSDLEKTKKQKIGHKSKQRRI